MTPAENVNDGLTPAITQDSRHERGSGNPTASEPVAGGAVVTPGPIAMMGVLTAVTFAPVRLRIIQFPETGSRKSIRNAHVGDVPDTALTLIPITAERALMFVIVALEAVDVFALDADTVAVSALLR